MANTSKKKKKYISCWKSHLTNPFGDRKKCKPLKKISLWEEEVGPKSLLCIILQLNEVDAPGHVYNEGTFSISYCRQEPGLFLNQTCKMQSQKLQ